MALSALNKQLLSRAKRAATSFSRSCSPRLNAGILCQQRFLHIHNNLSESNSHRGNALHRLDSHRQNFALQQRNEYITLPVAIAVTTVIGMYGSFIALRDRFNPVRKRPFSTVMKDTLYPGAGFPNDQAELEAVLSAISKHLPELDVNNPDLMLPRLTRPNPEVVKYLNETQQDTIMKLKRRFVFQVPQATLYLRPVNYNNSASSPNKSPSDSSASSASSAPEGHAAAGDVEVGELEKELMQKHGVCHAFWVINAGPVDYVLDCVLEGVRFEMVDNVDEVVKDSKSFIVKDANYSLSMSSYQLCDFVQQMSEKYKRTGYDLKGNNCLHFAYDFGRTFLPDKFSQFDKGGVKDLNIPVANENLLKWTKQILNK